MINFLIPFVFGVIILAKPEMFLKKDLSSEQIESKKALFKKIGWALIIVSFLSPIGDLLISASGR